MENNEILKQMLVSLIRKALFSLGAYLVTRGWISQDLANSLIGDSFVWYIVGAVLLIGTVIWQWAKVRFNVAALHVAVASGPDTSVSEVKQIVTDSKALTTTL